ncbi:MAG: DUF222 domain-containing protein [Nitriliruptorales bacterium]|nr:DUF222 domain-containing protein [Nitriliruptorales bacterium]
MPDRAATPQAYCLSMQSTRRVPSATADDLRQLKADLAAAEHHVARAVLAAGRLAGTGVSERVEGLPLDLFIGLAARLTGADRAMVIGAGQVLCDMPATAALFQRGDISWGQIRRITKAARSLRRHQRSELDERVAASADEFAGLDAFGPDQLCDAVDAAAADLRAPRSVERSEAAAQRANYFSVQRSMLGRVQFFGDYDEVTAAPIIGMLDAEAGQPHGCGGDKQQPTADDDETAEGAPHPIAADEPEAPARPTRRGGQYAAALATIAAAYLGGGLDANRARPLINVHVDLEQFTVNNAGMLELNVRGPLPRITLAALEVLSKDADCRAVIFDGARPLAVSKKLRAKDIPDDVMFATVARDLGDRWPASNDPPGHTEAHHIVHRARGGVHNVDDLVRLSRRYHRVGHRLGWHMRLDATTGVFTIKRGKRVWRSLPRGTPLSQPRRQTLGCADDVSPLAAPESALPF